MKVVSTLGMGGWGQGGYTACFLFFFVHSPDWRATIYPATHFPTKIMVLTDLISLFPQKIKWMFSFEVNVNWN